MQLVCCIAGFCFATFQMRDEGRSVGGNILHRQVSEVAELVNLIADRQSMQVLSEKTAQVKTAPSLISYTSTFYMDSRTRFCSLKA